MNSKMKKFKTMFIVTSLLLVGLIMLNGCKKSEPAPTETSAETMQQMQGHEGHEHEAMMAEPAKEAVTAAIVQTTCPVMGNPIDKQYFTEYKDKKVYFCCPGCQPEFEKNPEKYIAKLPQFNQ